MSLPKCFLEQKVAIVTGASAGIGRAIAHALANAGVSLVLAARHEANLQTVREEIVERTAVQVLIVPTDVSRTDDLRRLVDAAVSEFGHVHMLVNNAGIEAFQHLHELGPDQIAQVITTNLTGATQLTSLVIPHMLAAGWGHVVNMASTAGKHSPPFGAVYGATKAGLIALTQSLRLEYRSCGIGATAICPGFTTDGGIYDRIRTTLNESPPFFIGGTTADVVARAVVRAIRKDQPEVIVNSPPHRPFFVLTSLFPALGEYLFRKFGTRYFKRLGRTPAVAAAPPAPRRDAA
jgi:short-subunit dehydrogenase